MNLEDHLRTEDRTDHIKMQLHGRVPTASEAIRYFDDMAHGRLQYRQRGKGKRRRDGLSRSWYNGGVGVMKTQPPVKLITPVAMDLEQAKSRLRQMGQTTTTLKRRRKKKTVVKRAGNRTKKMVSKPKKQSLSKKYQDNFS